MILYYIIYLCPLQGYCRNFSTKSAKKVRNIPVHRIKIHCRGIVRLQHIMNTACFRKRRRGTVKQCLPAFGCKADGGATRGGDRRIKKASRIQRTCVSVVGRSSVPVGKPDRIARGQIDPLCLRRAKRRRIPRIRQPAFVDRIQHRIKKQRRTAAVGDIDTGPALLCRRKVNRTSLRAASSAFFRRNADDRSAVSFSRMAPAARRYRDAVI